MSISTDVYGTALSGLQAAGTRLAVSANNVANSTSTGYEAEEAVSRAQENGGVIVDIRSKNPATLTAPSPDGEGTVEVPNVSLDEEVISKVSAGYDFKANLKVVETQKKLDKALLDIQA